MRTFLTVIYLLFAGMAVLSVAVLFFYPFERRDVIVAIFFVVLAIMLHVLRRMYLKHFGRVGLLKPKINWKPMKREERLAEMRSSAFNIAMTSLHHNSMTKAAGGAEPNSVTTLVLREMLKIKALGFDRNPRSDDELRSEKKLWRFLETNNDDRSSPPLKELRGVRDKKIFWDLRNKVDDWYAARNASKDAYQDWLAEVGDTDQSHLLENGWVAFLESLPGADLNLWNGVATDFHEMYGDRLEAAFWIVEQAECDKATVSDFIGGFILFHMSEDYAAITAPNGFQERFSAVVEAYNNGFYKFHSLKAGIFNPSHLSDTEADRLLTRYEEILGLERLPRPKGLIDESVDPTDTGVRGYASPYAFWDDAGLHLTYPGENWREAR